jgi:hypothetical protein
VSSSAHTSAAVLTQAQAQAVLAEAIQIWSAVLGKDLPAINVSVAALSGDLLGYAAGSTIVLDLNAAGLGWFIDATPAESEEFAPAADGQLIAVAPKAINRYDLLTVVLHEIGHVLGYDHDDDAAGVMAAILAPSARRLPPPQLVDEILADWE